MRKTDIFGAREKLASTVLIVDDEIDIRDLIRELLRNEGFNLVFASNGRETLERIRECSPDVLLLDVMMPGMNGFEVCRHMRADSFSAEIPVILVTGLDDRQSRLKGIEAGADEFISKPFDKSELLLRIRTITRLNRYRKLHRAEESLHLAENELRILSAKLLNAQEGERKRVARELHDSIGQSLTAVKMGLEQIISQVEKKIDQAEKEALKAVTLKIQAINEEVRKISLNLRPMILDDLGILSTIKWLCREYQSLYPRIRVEREISINEREVPEEIKIVIFRILQEALNNTARHSKACRVLIRLTRDGLQLELMIQDDGQGFDIQHVYSHGTSAPGFGLANMRERVELSGGKFGIVSHPGAGTTIRAAWDVT
ncbi:MAG: response regulator [Spirochaetota bacterium]